MGRVTARDKALALIADKRILFDREHTTSHRYTFLVRGSDAFGDPYTVVIDARERIESCTCEGGQYHPIRARCSHAEAARLIAAAIGGPKE